MPEMCGDNRFEIIKAYRERLIDATNIEDSSDEMKVLDDILFRFWQMDWIYEGGEKKRQEVAPVVHAHWTYEIDDLFPADSMMICSNCGEYEHLGVNDNYCGNCGAKMDEEVERWQLK